MNLALSDCLRMAGRLSEAQRIPGAVRGAGRPNPSRPRNARGTKQDINWELAVQAPGAPTTQQPRHAPRRRRSALAAALAVLAAALGAGGLAYWQTGPPPPAGQVLEAPLDMAVAPMTGAPWLRRDAWVGSGLYLLQRRRRRPSHTAGNAGRRRGIVDFDGDGLLDVFLTGGGDFERPRRGLSSGSRALPNRRGREAAADRGQAMQALPQLGQLEISRRDRQAGLSLAWPYTHGVAVADYDRDGWPDLLVTGYGRLMLLHNEPDGKGGRRFADVTAGVGLHDTAWSTSAGWADLDGDGWPDLYVCHYVQLVVRQSSFMHRVCPQYAIRYLRSGTVQGYSARPISQ